LNDPSLRTASCRRRKAQSTRRDRACQNQRWSIDQLCVQGVALPFQRKADLQHGLLSSMLTPTQRL
jgi:hypothetical protein